MPYFLTWSAASSSKDESYAAVIIGHTVIGREDARNTKKKFTENKKFQKFESFRLQFERQVPIVIRF